MCVSIRMYTVCVYVRVRVQNWLEGLVPLPDHPLPCSFTPSITGQTERALCWKLAGAPPWWV